MQKSFDPLDYLGTLGHLNGKRPEDLAKKERNEAYKSLTKAGYRCRRWVLRNQLRKYAGFGIPDGSVRDVYMLDVEEA